MKKAVGQKINTFNIRLPDEIVKWMDELVENGIYNSRSEIIRDMTREFLKQNKG